MIYNSYFEIGGEVVTCETPAPQNPQPVIRTFMAVSTPKSVATGRAAGPKSDIPIRPISRPYSVGVGYGNPIMWLASNALIYSIGLVSESEMWPQTTTEDRNLY